KKVTKKVTKETAAKKPATKKAAPEKKTPEETPTKSTPGYTGSDLAAEFSIDPGELRKHLRALKIEKPGKQWAWSKKTDPALKDIRAQVKERIKSLEGAPAKKEKKPAKKAEAKTPEKKTTAKKTTKKKASKG
ncbi:MAG: hypothetical protein QQN63_02570, partial [Nitrosopumilus sp.]